jgi:hypothetical protein
LRKKDRTKGVSTLAQEAETSGAIRVSRNEFQVDSGDVPEKAKPDEEPQIPAQQEELYNRYADEHVPEAGGGQVPRSTGHGIPGRSVEPDPTVPEPRAQRVDNKQKPDLDWDGIAQPYR